MLYRISKGVRNNKESDKMIKIKYFFINNRKSHV